MVRDDDRCCDDGDERGVRGHRARAGVTGRIDVTAVDSTGAVVPGVTVEISGGQKAMSVTDARGEAHFLGLAPGKYTVIAKLSGFSDYKNDAVQVGAGASATLRATMSVGGVTACEPVEAETPMLDTRREVGLDQRLAR